MRKLRNSELGRKTVGDFRKAEKFPVIIVLDNVRSLNNIGSVFRTADAFLVEEIYLCGITAKPPHRDIQKTALGATDSVKWSYYPETLQAIEELNRSGYYVVSLEQAEDSISLSRFSPELGKKTAFVFGNEINGVGQQIVDLSDTVVEIPQFGTKHSFNISVSTGIVLWDYFSKIHSQRTEREGGGVGCSPY